jgi:hypothetical protein
MIRVSAANYLSLRTPDGKYILLANYNLWRNHHKIVYTPIGGGIAATAEGLDFLHQLGAQDFEQKNDLCFRLPESQIENKVNWFMKAIQRETSPERETLEELVLETNLLNLGDLYGELGRTLETEIGDGLGSELDEKLWAALQGKLVNMAFSDPSYGHEFAFSDHCSPGNFVYTLRIGEIFPTQTSETLMNKLLALDTPLLAIVEEEEIWAGKTKKTETPIGSNSKMLLSPQAQIILS